MVGGQFVQAADHLRGVGELGDGPHLGNAQFAGKGQAQLGAEGLVVTYGQGLALFLSKIIDDGILINGLAGAL